jgi:hypothetical protein
MLFNIVYNFLALTGTVWILHDISHYFMPMLTTKIRDCILWQGLKVYTMLTNRTEYCIKKGLLLLSKYLHINTTINNKENIHFIYDGNVVNSYSFNDAIVCKCETRPECDFILQFVKRDTHNNEKFDYDVLRFATYKDLVEFNTTDTTTIYTPSSVKFLGMNIVISNVSKQIDIILPSTRSNFFMNSNVLFDRPFIKFYLKKFHDIILKDHEDYTISFIDNEMEVIKFKDDHYLELYDNSYKICFNRS